jgi:fructosamine-3-kinase
MEGLELRSGANHDASVRMAERLAALHQVRPPDGRYGADFDNFIGATPQSNTHTDSWADFFVQQRLEPQLTLAAARGRAFSNTARLLSAVHCHLASLKIEPALLHGDLWGGNAGFLSDGEPVVFDPASYFGDRETDLAFTGLFGGFGPAFHHRYRELVPAPEPVRHSIYNLYHLLNHFHLFGGGYAEQSAALMREILHEIG